ncbi:MAG TPA: DUF4097 family beta strand repeat-containing protein [bacterium]
MKNRTFGPRVCIAVLFAAAMLNGSTLTKDFQKTLPLEPNRSVTVRNTNGFIEARAWDKDSLALRAEIEIRGHGEREIRRMMDRVRVKAEIVDGDAVIDVEYPRSETGWSFWDWIFGRRVEVRVQLTLDLPARIRLDAKSVNGRVDVVGLSGRATLYTTNGRVSVERHSGDVHARTVNGSITVAVDDFPKGGSIDLGTTNGSIRLALQPDVQADVRASTVNGGIFTDFPVAVQGKFVSKHLNGGINGGGGSIDLKTVNGSIHIQKE